MAEHRTIDEVMAGREVQPAAERDTPGAEGDRSAGLTTADMAGAGSADHAQLAPAPAPEPQAATQERSDPAPARQDAAPASAAGEGTGEARTTSTPASQEQERAPLFTGDESESLRSRWQDIQTGFVDEPHRAVEQADGLVAEVMQQLARTFADERSTLESQWSHGQDISTEDLRMALRRYRSFFDRLLSI